MEDKQYLELKELILGIISRLDKLEKRFDDLVTSVKSQFDEHSERFDRMEQRLDRLEQKVNILPDKEYIDRKFARFASANSLYLRDET